MQSLSECEGGGQAAEEKAAGEEAEMRVTASAERNGPRFSSRVITHVRLLFKNPALLIKASHRSTSGTGQ